MLLTVKEARLPEGGGGPGMVGCRVGVGGAEVGVGPGRGVMVGGSEAQASITIRKTAIHMRRIKELYQGKRINGFCEAKDLSVRF